jgi:SOS-response transcriptional repressor LexA
MPRKLTERQREYLDFIRDYIQEKNSAPRLDEIAGHFGVKSPTANKMLKTLEQAGQLYFNRDNLTGFYIRLPDIIETDAPLVEIGIVGRVNKYGEIFDFPRKHGHFPIVLPGADPKNLFALDVWQHIHHADILGFDLIICDQSKTPKTGDLCIIPLGKRWILILLGNEQVPGQFEWLPLAYDETTKDYFWGIFEENNVELIRIKQDLILATVLLLKRALSL